MAERITVVVDPDLEPIIPRYLEIRRKELAELQAALAAGDHEAARMLGHRLKGSGASYGLEELTRLGAAIEDAALDGDMDAAGARTDEVAHYLEHLDVVYGEAGGEVGSEVGGEG